MCRDESSFMILLYIVLYVMMPVLTVIYACYRVLSCLCVNKEVNETAIQRSRPSSYYFLQHRILRHVLTQNMPDCVSDRMSVPV